MLSQLEAQTSPGTWGVIAGVVSLICVNVGKWLNDNNRTKAERALNQQRHEDDVEHNRIKQVLFERMATSNDRIVEKLAEIKTGQVSVCRAACPNNTVINNITKNNEPNPSKS